MDNKAIDTSLITIAEKRIELNQIDYNDKNYDKVEEELHDLEDDFMDKYGDDIEKILNEIHQEHCPESDVLSPIAYVAKQYIKADENEDGSAKYGLADTQQGVLVEPERFEVARLVIMPNPFRILMIADDGKHIEEVWKSA